ncbi:MAG: cytochrome b/b6 domain-containing protein [Dongiaceae bacterium]
MVRDDTVLKAVPLWDLPTRLFHWALVICLLTSWYFGENGPLRFHYISGLVIIGLLVFRILWGLFGSPSARFIHFVRHPRDAIAYMRAIRARKPSYTFGHNAAGGLMVVALILIVALQASTGLFTSDFDNFDGPLYNHVPGKVGDFLSSYHHFNFYAILVLAGLHILAILFYRFWKRENLVRAMITGKAVLPESVAKAVATNGHVHWVPIWRAVLCAVIAAILPIWIYLHFPLESTY